MSSSSFKVFTQTPGGTQAKQLQQAVAFFKKSLKTSPTDTSSMHALGVIQCQLGQIDEGIEWLEKALNINPMNADILYHYGLALMEVRRLGDAIKSFQGVVEIDPKNAEAFYHLGVALVDSRQEVEAETAYQKAIALNPNYVEALNNLGNLFSNQSKYLEAIECYRRAMVLQPTYVMPYNNMGLTLVSLGKLDEAERHYRQAIKMMPNYPEAINNLGIIYRMRGQFEESKQHMLQALALRPAYPEALNNLGNAYKDLGQMDKAVVEYKKAIQLEDNPDYRHNLSLSLLAAGHYEEGLQEYEYRWASKQLAAAKRSYGVPEWRGEPAEGKTLLITSEQGFGDTLQFSRYALLAKERGLRVIMDVPPALKRVISSLSGVDQVVARGETLPSIDLHCPMMSLPYAFKTTVATIPAPVPYLFAEPAAVEVWKNRLASDTRKKRVGLVWAGSSRMYSQDLLATDRRRSLAPEMLAPIMGVAGVEFYSLQKIGVPMPPDYNIKDYMNLCEDFADTAALVANLDLVISVDTAMVHLTGALGKAVWMLNRFDSCWRWLQNRDDSPWYPNLRQFRQPSPGDWDSVVARVRDELGKFATEA